MTKPQQHRPMPTTPVQQARAIRRRDGKSQGFSAVLMRTTATSWAIHFALGQPGAPWESGRSREELAKTRLLDANVDQFDRDQAAVANRRDRKIERAVATVVAIDDYVIIRTGGGEEGDVFLGARTARVIYAHA